MGGGFGKFGKERKEILARKERMGEIFSYRDVDKLNLNN